MLKSAIDDRNQTRHDVEKKGGSTRWAAGKGYIGLSMTPRNELLKNERPVSPYPEQRVYQLTLGRFVRKRDVHGL